MHPLEYGPRVLPPSTLPSQLLLCSKTQAIFRGFTKHISKQHSQKCHEFKKSIYTIKGNERTGSGIFTEKHAEHSVEVGKSKEREKNLKTVDLEASKGD